MEQTSKQKSGNATGIVIVVFSSLLLALAIVLFIGSFTFARIEQDYWYSSGLKTNTALLAVSLIWSVFLVVLIVMGVNLIKKAKDGTAEEINSLTTGILVLSILCGNMIMVVMAIVTLCTGNEYKSDANLAAVKCKTPTSANSEFEQAMARLKQYKADDIIDEKTFKEKAENLFRKHYLSEGEPKSN